MNRSASGTVVTKPTLIGGKSEIDAIVDALRRGRCCRFIGPRYHQKSRIMRYACAQVDERLGYAALYISLRDARTTSDETFYTSLRDLIATKAHKHYRLRLNKQTTRSPADLERFLTALPCLLHANVALFVDDLELEVVPPDYIGELLRILRAAHLETKELHLLAVVCASHNLARTALGPTSPLHSVSDLVILQDLSRADAAEWTRQQFSVLQCLPPTCRALDYLYEQTAGDRLLINEVCRECCRWIAPQRNSRVTIQVVKSAMESLVQRGGHSALADGIHQIESDPQLLRALLLLVQRGEMPANEIPLDLTKMPDPLITSGLVSRQGNRYQIKSDLHYHLLQRAFPRERIGRIFLAAGDHEQAMRYLRGDVRAVNEIEERSRMMLSFVSAMHAMPDKRAAFDQLARGLQMSYPQQSFSLYDYDAKRQVLTLVHPPHHSKSAQISLRASKRPEIKALRTPWEYYWSPSRGHHRTLFIPLRVVEGENLGLVVVENLLTRQNFRRRQGQIRELTNYLQYAARALKNRTEFEQLHLQSERRARDLQHLLRITRELMCTQGTFRQVLEQTLNSAIKALRGRAQMGSIYLYDPQTDRLTIAADSGYSAQIRAAARFRPGEGLAGYVYSTGRLWNVHDTSNDKHYIPLKGVDLNILSAVGVPLLGRHSILGVLCLDSFRQVNAFDRESVQLLTIFAGQVALWLERARFTDVLRRKRNIANLAAELVHQIKGTVASIPDVTKEIEAEIQTYAQAQVLRELFSELRDKALNVTYISKWLNQFIKVGDLVLEMVDIPALIAEVCQHAEKRCPPHIRIRQLPARADNLSVRADRALISILIENLLENAFEAIPPSQDGEITLRVEREEPFCVTQVWNNGPSIPPDDRERIWEAGWTTKGVSTSGLRGLGLALCQHIAQAHDGALALQDSPAGGVTFVLRLPVQGPEVEAGDYAA